jgi:phosphoglycerate dehydrogenase-like enzyme
VLSPHVAGLTTAAQERVVSAIAADVETVLAGGTPVNAVTTVRTAT